MGSHQQRTRVETEWANSHRGCPLRGGLASRRTRHPLLAHPSPLSAPIAASLSSRQIGALQTNRGAAEKQGNRVHSWHHTYKYLTQRTIIKQHTLHLMYTALVHVTVVVMELHMAHPTWFCFVGCLLGPLSLRQFNTYSERGRSRSV